MCHYFTFQYQNEFPEELHTVLKTHDLWHKPYDNEHTVRAVTSWEAEALLALNWNTIRSSFSTQSPTLVSFGCWLPVFSTNYWQTNLPLFIDVRVIDLCFKCNLRRFEWIFCWEVDFDSEGSFIIWRIVLQQEGRMSKSGIFLWIQLRKSMLQALIYQVTSFKGPFFHHILPRLCVRKHPNLLGKREATQPLQHLYSPQKK